MNDLTKSLLAPNEDVGAFREAGIAGSNSSIALSYSSFRSRLRRIFVIRVIVFILLLLLAAAVLSFFIRIVVPLVPSNRTKSSLVIPCDRVGTGYNCKPEISRLWGPYSPYFSVPSQVTTDIPLGCRVSFAQVLSRHGGRYPTTEKSKIYKATIKQIQTNVDNFGAKYAFLKDYDYDLDVNRLTRFGQRQMVNSGIKFYRRYRALAKTSIPFIRASGQDRVIMSAKNFSQGYHKAREADYDDDDAVDYPYPILMISEAGNSNNTLSHGLCPAFETGRFSEIAESAQSIFQSTFLNQINARLNDDLPGANLTALQTLYMMDLCPFDTVAHVDGSVSPFCRLFTPDEWRAYDYHGTIGKYYSFGPGNPLGPTQGIGFVSELIARITGTPVIDQTTVNHTLDSNTETFPLNKTLYADFSHDNTMTSIMAALNLYNFKPQLSNQTIEDADTVDGYSASWSVPFAARVYIEKMACSGNPEEMIRILVNDRVAKLGGCAVDEYGRCPVKEWVRSLHVARKSEKWNQC